MIERKTLYLIILYSFFPPFFLNAQQVKETVVLTLKSKLDSQLIFMGMKDVDHEIKLKVKNIGNQSVKIVNVPLEQFEFEVKKLINGEYITIDSVCRLTTFSPTITNKEFKDISFKPKKSIKFSAPYPPGCMYIAGDYKIRFFFRYRFEGKILKADTNWYSVKVKSYLFD